MNPADRVNYAQSAFDAVNEATPGNEPELVALYTLLALVRGTETTLADVHDAWAMWRLLTRPDHPDLVPFDELSPEIQEYDAPYRDAIHQVARELPGGDR